jgi:N-acetylmuramoyl-L-alanine amidase
MPRAAFFFVLLGLAVAVGSASLRAADSSTRSAPSRPVPPPPALEPLSRPLPPKPKTSSPAVPAAKDQRAEAKPAPKAAATPSVAYIGGKEVARALHLTPTWDTRTRRLTLADATTRLVLELDNREMELNGRRVFLSAPTAFRNGELAVSRIDFQRLLTPAIRPGQGAVLPPAVKTIVLDPGHGGRDTGKVNSRVNVVEKDMTLDTARRVKTLLESAGFKVVLTRTEDRFLALPDRAEIATRAGADLFVSLHYNAVESDAERVTGVEVYTMTPQYQLSTDRRPDDQVPVFNPGNFHDHWNTVLGVALHRSLLQTLKVPDRGLKRGRYAVLRLARCPAVLIEAGFLSHDGEARKVASPEYRQQIAEAVAAGIKAYVATVRAAD